MHRIRSSVSAMRTLDSLLKSRANLHHLIYAMEHDPSLGAVSSQISTLRLLLRGIEHELPPKYRRHPGAHHAAT